MAFGHEVLAHRTHRRLNLGLLVAGALVVALGAASISVTILSGRQVATEATPHASAAIDLTTVQDDIDHVELDDELTLSDRDEDCLTATTARSGYPVVCANEQDALTYLSKPTLLAGHLDAVRRQLGPTAQSTRVHWRAAEHKLPTLQNLADQAAKQAAGRSGEPRYDPGFVKNLLKPYTDPATAPSTKGYFDTLYTSVHQATRHEWSDYATGVRDARALLGALAYAGLVLGVAGGVAAGLGCRPRIAEYWSRGGSAA
jgi:hypothetical protein